MHDERLATPERTWETYSGALRSGDRETARFCLTESAEAERGPMLDSATSAQMRDWASSVRSVQARVDAGGSTAMATASLQNGRTASVSFMKTARGWRIASLPQGL